MVPLVYPMLNSKFVENSWLTVINFESTEEQTYGHRKYWVLFLYAWPKKRMFVIFTADTMVPDEIDQFKSLIMQQIHQAKIKEI